MQNTQEQIARLGQLARLAVKRRDWATLTRCADEILRRDAGSAEGHFLTGLALKGQRDPEKAIQSFTRALELDPARYDAAVELANRYSVARRNPEAAQLLARYEDALSNSPLYLDLAGTVYTEIGMPERAWPLFEKASSLQPEIDVFKANLATCAVYLGKIEQAREIYLDLLSRNPAHRSNHYQLSRLARATDSSHIDQMKAILADSENQPGADIPLYFAIGKELEDLERWDEAFEYFRKGGQAVCTVSHCDAGNELAMFDAIRQTCDARWLADNSRDTPLAGNEKKPIFITGLPRTGSTLVERILSSHSEVGDLGETMFLQSALRQQSGLPSTEAISAKTIAALADKDMGAVARGYLAAGAYRVGEEPMFIEKLPLNFLYLGFIARAFPAGRMIYVHRNPMDVCFSMFKQVFTWAYQFSYCLESLGRYYIAHHRLLEHWRQLLGDRLVEVSYEALVSEPEAQIRSLLDRVGLAFEPACLEFEKNRRPSATASSVQVREGMRSSSVGRWKHYEKQLAPLREQLENAGIRVD